MMSAVPAEWFLKGRGNARNPPKVVYDEYIRCFQENNHRFVPRLSGIRHDRFRDGYGQGGVRNVPTPDYKTDQIKGMTDTQKDTIFELFRMYVPRGRIFLTPMVIDLRTTLRQWGVNEEFKTFTSYNMPRAG
jgi:hypothetical protein